MDRWGVVIILGAFVFAWMYRYDISGTAGLDRPPGVYVLDRWTGSLQYCQMTQCMAAGTRYVSAPER